MGLKDLPGMDVPDNKGGRPPKEEEEVSGRDVDGDPFRIPDQIVEGGDNIDPDKKKKIKEEEWEKYWKSVWEDNYSEDKSLHEVVSDCCEFSYCLPRTVVIGVQKSGAFDFTDHEDEYEEALGYLNKEKESKKKKSRSKKSKIDTSKTSGLAGLINKNK